MKFFLVFFLVIMLAFLPSCKVVESDANNCETTSLLGLIEYTNAEIIEEKPQYRIISFDGKIYCFFYDELQQLVKVECNLGRLPKIIVTDSGLLRFTVQSGTGVATQWGYYYNSKTGAFSENFYSIHDEANQLTVYTRFDTEESNWEIIIRDIFDPSKFYLEIDTFAYPFSATAYPFSEILFSKSGDAIQFSYYSGDNYELVSEIVSIV